MLPCVEIEPPREADAAVIWLHGLGADGHDFEPIVPELQLGRHGIRFVFPHAPSLPVTVNAGYVMPAWFDIRSPRIDALEDEAGIRRSAEQLQALIRREEERGIACERVVLAGFSQGGAIALHTGLRHGERLAGLIVLSAYLPLAASLRAEASPANEAAPIFMGHGSHDSIVPVELGRAARDRLRADGHPVEWHEYPMPHTVSREEILAIGGWLRRALGTGA